MAAATGRSWRERIQLYGGTALGLGALVVFLWSVEWGALVAVLGRVRWSWIAVAAALMLLDYAVHAWRWKVLLRNVDPGLDWRTLWTATSVLWAFNTLLPLRAGNLLRPAVVAAKRGVPYTTLLFTTIAETVLDVLGIVILVLWMLQILPDGADTTGRLAELRGVGTWAALAALVALGGVVLLSSRRARTIAWALTRPLPSRRVRWAVLQRFDQLVEGVAAIGSPRLLVEALALTLAVWGGWLLAILATLRAFDIALPLAGALFMETALTLSMILPQAPGFLGVFQVVVEEALGLFGIEATEGKAIALVFWTVCFVPITVIGAWEGWRAGVAPGAKARTFEKLEERARR